MIQVTSAKSETGSFSPAEGSNNIDYYSQNSGQQKMRKSTDRSFILLLAAFMFCWGGLMVYCVRAGDITRITNGYDNFGSLCGAQNYEREDFHRLGTEGVDYRFRPYLVVLDPKGRTTLNVTLTGLWNMDDKLPKTISKTLQRACLVQCWMYPNLVRRKSRCVSKKSKELPDVFLGKTGTDDFFAEVSEDLEQSWRDTLYVQIGGGVLSLLMLILFIFNPVVMTWFTLIGGVIICAAFVSFMWYLWIEQNIKWSQKDYVQGKLEIRRSTTYLACAIIFSGLILILIYLGFKLKTKLGLILQLLKHFNGIFKEMRLLILLPISTSVFVASVIAACWHFSLWIESAGYLTILNSDYNFYKKDALIIVTRWYNIFMLFILTELVINCQRVIVAVAVSLWYFKKNGEGLGMPIMNGLYILLRYHIGSVSMGSLLICILKLPSIILNSTQRVFGFWNVECCPCYLKTQTCILPYVNNDSFYEVVLRGSGFYEGAKRAYEILQSRNVPGRRIATTFQLFLTFFKISLVMTTVTVSAGILRLEESYQHFWFLLTLSGFLSHLISNCFVAIYQVTAQAIFICFHEDFGKDYVDGPRPHRTFQDFLNLLENIQNSYRASEKNLIKQAWPGQTQQNKNVSF